MELNINMSDVLGEIMGSEGTLNTINLRIARNVVLFWNEYLHALVWHDFFLQTRG